MGDVAISLINSMYLLNSRNHARMPHCLRWGGMASLLGGLGDRFPQHNRELPSKSPAACGGDLYSFGPNVSADPSALFTPRGGCACTACIPRLYAPLSRGALACSACARMYCTVPAYPSNMAKTSVTPVRK